MNIGMLWFDNDPKTGLDKKIERAAAYYRTKYGRTPTLCFVHPSMMPGRNGGSRDGRNAEPVPKNIEAPENYIAGGVEVRGNRSVLPNHLWIGVNGSSEAAQARP